MQATLNALAWVGIVAVASVLTALIFTQLF
jgi:hypothetical protein